MSHTRSQARVRRLLTLSRGLERMLTDGRYHALPRRVRRGLVRRLVRLYAAVAGEPWPLEGLRRLTAAGVVALAVAACDPAGPDNNNDDDDIPVVVADDPSFAQAVQNALGLVAVVGTDPAEQNLTAPAFADIDYDGDADLFVGAGGGESGIVAFFENDGTADGAIFLAPANYPGLPDDGVVEGPRDGGAIPVLAPLDGDADFDLVMGSITNWYPGSAYFQNDAGTFVGAGMPTGLPQEPDDAGPPDAGRGGAVSYAFADLDDDGDLDALVSIDDIEDVGSVHTLSYYENTGGAASPVFEDQLTALGLTHPAGTLALPAFVDIDADEDFDVFLGDGGGNLQYHENTGTKSAPQFAAAVENPFGLEAVPGGNAAPAFMDLDADGDFDLLVGDYDGNLWYYENTNL